MAPPALASTHSERLLSRAATAAQCAFALGQVQTTVPRCTRSLRQVPWKFKFPVGLGVISCERVGPSPDEPLLVPIFRRIRLLPGYRWSVN